MYLEHPYKLCDYKPLYGCAFHDEIKGYEYWGYSDIDIIFGEIDYFLKPYLEKGFDKLFRFGHFSIIRSTIENNTIFKNDEINYNFKFIKSTSISCLFDEVSINKIFAIKEKHYIIDQLFHNVNINYKNFAVGNGLRDSPELIIKKGQKLLLAHLKDDEIIEKEFFYIHFMKRSNLSVVDVQAKNYAITVDGFLPFNSTAELKRLFLKYGFPVSPDEEIEYKNLLSKSRRKNKLRTFKRELRHYKLKAIYNVLYHYFLHKLWRY